MLMYISLIFHILKFGVECVVYKRIKKALYAFVEKIKNKKKKREIEEQVVIIMFIAKRKEKEITK